MIEYRRGQARNDCEDLEFCVKGQVKNELLTVGCLLVSYNVEYLWMESVNETKN